MRALIQRVTQASVSIDNHIVGEIDQGLLVLLGIEKNDDATKLKSMLHKLLNYRVFTDAAGKMNLSISHIKGDLLIVSQFTLAADTHKGLRPSFSSAAEPTLAEQLYNDFIELAQQQALANQIHIATGRFGADMQVSLINNGPVTFLLEV